MTPHYSEQKWLACYAVQAQKHVAHPTQHTHTHTIKSLPPSYFSLTLSSLYGAKCEGWAENGVKQVKHTEVKIKKKKKKLWNRILGLINCCTFALATETENTPLGFCLVLNQFNNANRAKCKRCTSFLRSQFNTWYKPLILLKSCFSSNESIYSLTTLYSTTHNFVAYDYWRGINGQRALSHLPKTPLNH